MALSIVNLSNPLPFSVVCHMVTPLDHVLEIGINHTECIDSGGNFREQAALMATWAAAIIRLARLRGCNQDDPAGTFWGALEAAEFIGHFAEFLLAAEAASLGERAIDEYNATRDRIIDNWNPESRKQA